MTRILAGVLIVLSFVLRFLGPRMIEKIRRARACGSGG